MDKVDCHNVFVDPRNPRVLHPAEMSDLCGLSDLTGKSTIDRFVSARRGSGLPRYFLLAASTLYASVTAIAPAYAAGPDDSDQRVGRAQVAPSRSLFADQAILVDASDQPRTVNGAPPNDAANLPGAGASITALPDVAYAKRPPNAGQVQALAVDSEGVSAGGASPAQLLALFSDEKDQSSTSLDSLDVVLANRQVFSDLRTLQDRINEAKRPTANVVVRHSSQSDKLDINQLELSQDLFFSEGRSQLRLGLMGIDYDPKIGRSITHYAAGFTGKQQINDLAAFTGEFWLNRLRVDGVTHVQATYNAFVTLRPSDAVRIDLNASRRLFDNIRSLQLNLSVRSYGGSIDFAPDDDLRLTARGSYSDYSDGNQRRTEEVEGVWRITSRPVIEVGLRGTNFHFSRLLNNGYFNPREYYSGEGMFRLQSSISEKFTVELAGSAGAEHSRPGGTKPLIKGSLQVVYKLFDRWSLDGELSYFSSRQSTSSGFSRATALIGLHYRF